MELHRDWSIVQIDKREASNQPTIIVSVDRLLFDIHVKQRQNVLSDMMAHQKSDPSIFGVIFCHLLLMRNNQKENQKSITHGGYIDLSSSLPKFPLIDNKVLLNGILKRKSFNRVLSIDKRP